MNCKSCTSAAEPTRRRRRGMTLAEMLVTIAITVILVTLLYQIVEGSVRAASKSMVQAELQETGTFIVNQVRTTLERCDQAGVAMLPETGRFTASMHTVVGVTPSLHKQYAQDLSVFSWEQGPQTLRYWRYRPPGLDVLQPRKLVSSEVSTVLLRPADRKLSQNVTAFEIRTSSQPYTEQPLTLIVELTKNASGTNEMFRAEHSICLRCEL